LIDNSRPLLSIETLTYLIFEGVNFCEEFELALREHRTDLKPHLRRLHLLVTALHEFIETLKNYSQSTHFTKEVREPILKVVHAVSQSLFFLPSNGSVVDRAIDQ
jgi:timeless protein